MVKGALLPQKWISRAFSYPRFWLAILIIVFVMCYFKVPFIFFQQDEWLGFGLIIDFGSNFVVQALKEGVNHFVPLTFLFDYLSFKAFGLHYIAYNSIGLMIHAINAGLTYFIVLRLLKDKRVALISAILFISSSIASQFIMWPVVSLNTVSLTFSLIGLMVVAYKDTFRNQFIPSVLIAISSLAAFLVIEYAIGLILFIPIFILLLSEKRYSIKNLIFLMPFLFGVLCYLVIRVYLSIITKMAPTAGSGLFNLTKFVKYPLRYFGQTILPQNSILRIANIFTKNAIVAQTTLFTRIAESLGMLLIALMIVLFFKCRDKYKRETNILLISFLFTLTSALPFLLIPGESGYFLIFPPRYLYFGLLGIVLTWSSIMSLAIKNGSKVYIVLVGLLLSLITINGIKDNIDTADTLYAKGSIRYNILSTIKRTYTLLPPRSIFYVSSDTSYYGLPVSEKILPFQSGFGQTLLIWYYPEEVFPRGFYTNKFLWEIRDQGYQEANQRGYGYIRDYKLLKEILVKNSLSSDNVIAFSWNGSQNILSNQTTMVREKLAGKK